MDEPAPPLGFAVMTLIGFCVLLFGLLIPFHIAIGVYWTAYGEHLNPNVDERTETSAQEDDERNRYTTETVDPTSLFLHWMHQWRLAALFMISGMGTALPFGVERGACFRPSA